jgi:hypothetical protein
MRLLSSERFRCHAAGRPVVNGFLSYISQTDPVLMLCTGYEDYSDGYDDFSTSVSRDNGATWGPSRPWLRGREVAGGRLRYAEPAEVQMSNFRFYQDRATGDLVVFLTRYAERRAKEWMLADYYRYRVEIT